MYLSSGPAKPYSRCISAVSPVSQKLLDKATVKLGATNCLDFRTSNCIGCTTSSQFGNIASLYAMLMLIK